MEITGYEVPSIEDIFYLSLEVAKKIIKEGIEYDVLVGISRGGLIPTRLLSDFLRIEDVRIIRSIYYTGTGERLEKPIADMSTLGEVDKLMVLIVDDVADTGNTLALIRDEIKKNGAKEVDIATLYVKPWRKINVKFFAKETDKWIVFPWEIREVLEDLREKGTDKKLLKLVKDRKEFIEVLKLLDEDG